MLFSAAHTPDNSFLGFVSEEALRMEPTKDGLEPETYRKERIAVVYGKQDYMWQVESLEDKRINKVYKNY